LDIEKSITLEIGCGTCQFAPYLGLSKLYVPTDIILKYLINASKTSPGNHVLMSADSISFADGTFDNVVVIATLHHLSEEMIILMLKESKRVLNDEGYVHIIDAILPDNKLNFIKYLLLKMDRGEYVRTYDQLYQILNNNQQIIHSEILNSFPQNTCYFKLK